MKTSQRAAVAALILAAAGGAWFAVDARMQRSQDRSKRVESALAETIAEFQKSKSSFLQASTEIDSLRARLASADIPEPQPSSPVTFSTLTHDERRLAEALARLALSQTERAKALSAWVFSSIKPADDIEQSRVLSTLTGQCGNRDLIVSSIASAFGIPARRIAFFNVPVQLSHAATELYVENRWRFFDSTSGIYFSLKGSEEPIGLSEARTAYPNIDVWQSDQEQWTGRWQPVGYPRYKKLTGNYIYDPTDATSVVIDIERTYFASAMAGAVEEPVFFTSVVVGPASKAVNLGARDQSPFDLVSAGGERYSPLLESIGRYDSILTGTRFVFQTDRVRRARVKVGYLSQTGYILSDLDHAALKFGVDATRVERRVVDGVTEYIFDIYPPSSVFSLWARGKSGATVDFITAKSFDNVP